VVVLVLSVGFIVSVVALHSEFIKRWQSGADGCNSHCEGYEEILGAGGEAGIGCVACVASLELEDASGAIGLGKVLCTILKVMHWSENGEMRFWSPGCLVSGHFFPFLIGTIYGWNNQWQSTVIAS
jgi:hypothetical protein